MCLVETAEQLVPFGHDGLRSSLGQNALRSPVYWLNSPRVGVQRDTSKGNSSGFIPVLGIFGVIKLRCDGAPE